MIARAGGAHERACCWRHVHGPEDEVDAVLRTIPRRRELLLAAGFLERVCEPTAPQLRYRLARRLVQIPREHQPLVSAQLALDDPRLLETLLRIETQMRAGERPVGVPCDEHQPRLAETVLAPLRRMRQPHHALQVQTAAREQRKTIFAAVERKGRAKNGGKSQGLCDHRGLIDVARAAASAVDLLKKHDVGRQRAQGVDDALDAGFGVTDVESDEPQATPGSKCVIENVDIILHRPQSSDNIGAVARAMKNFGLSRLVLVAPRRYEADRAHTLAVHAGDVLDAATIVPTLEDAVAPYALVIPTTARAMRGRPPPITPRQAARELLSVAPPARTALMFGEEATGLSNERLSRFALYSSIPADPDRSSLNLAQAVLLYGWELHQEAGEARMPERLDAPGPGEVPAPSKLVTLLRERARSLLVGAGFLIEQNPDRPLDELMRLLQRGHPTQREIEMLLAAVAQLERTSAVPPRR